jgi:hypothetical protein
METDVICPDCGKVIAPPGAVDNAARCRCGESRGAKISAADVPVRPSIRTMPKAVMTRAAPRQETEAEAAVANKTTKEKKCYVCGADLTGRVRFKDSAGHYWCKDCTSQDKKKREEETRCPDCGRVFPEEKLVYFQTEKVCSSCFREREKVLEKKIKKAAAEKIHQKAEWGSIKWMSIGAGVLLALGTIGYLMSR